MGERLRGGLEGIDKDKEELRKKIREMLEDNNKSKESKKSKDDKDDKDNSGNVFINDFCI